MARTYNTTHLAYNPNTSNAAHRPLFALAYVRFLLEDKPDAASNYPSQSLQDEEINVFLEGTRVQDKASEGGDDTYYYFPHRAAARIIRSRPSYADSYGFSGYRQTNRNASEIANAIISANRWSDEKIRSTTNDRVGSLSVEVVL